MNQFHCAIVLVVALIALPAFATEWAGSTTSNRQGLTIIPVESARLIPTDLSYVWTADGLELRGRIKKRYDYRGRILGHVEIELLDANGALVGRQAGALQGFNPSRNNPDWARFQARIDDVPADVVTIRVEHAVGARD